MKYFKQGEFVNDKEEIKGMNFSKRSFILDLKDLKPSWCLLYLYVEKGA